MTRQVILVALLFTVGCSEKKKESDPAAAPAPAAGDPSTMDKVNDAAERAKVAATKAGEAGMAATSAAASGVISAAQITPEMKAVADKLAANARATQAALMEVMNAKTDQAKKLGAEKAKKLKEEALALKAELEKLRVAAGEAGAAAGAAGAAAVEAGATAVGQPATP